VKRKDRNKELGRNTYRRENGKEERKQANKKNQRN
jgi:hypothetical protein